MSVGKTGLVILGILVVLTLILIVSAALVCGLPCYGVGTTG